MDALRLRAPGRLERFDAPEPREPAEGEVLVEVQRVGVCGTDYHAYHGDQPYFTYPRILGHEIAARVVAIGPGVAVASATGAGVTDAGVTDAGARVADAIGPRPGDACAVMPYMSCTRTRPRSASCARCIACRRGRPNCCRAIEVLGVHVDGALQTHIVVPASQVFAARQLSPDQIVLVEPLAIAAHAVARAAPEPGEHVLVLGAGPIGLGVLQLCAARGARVVALDRDAARLEFARRRLGITTTVRAGDGDIAAVRDATDGDMPTVVFDATGSRASMQRAFELVAHSGRLCFVGLVQDDIAFADPLLHAREITLLASRNATAAEFVSVIELIRGGRIDTAPWITHRTTLAAACEDFPRFAEPGAGVVKAVIEVGA